MGRHRVGGSGKSDNTLISGTKMQIYTQMLTVKILWKIVFYWFKVDISVYLLLIIYFRNAYSARATPDDIYQSPVTLHPSAHPLPAP